MRLSRWHAVVAAVLTSSCAGDTPEVTRDNFATAETLRYLQDFTDQGAVNQFIHEADVVDALDQQTVIRSNIDMFYSHADGTLTFHFGCGDDALNNIDITEGWTFALRMYGPQESILNMVDAS